MSNFELPELREIEVSPDCLVLDPNNPRLMLVVTDGEQIPDEDVALPGVVERINSLVRGGTKDRFQIAQLEKSIQANGWQPVDCIFVKRIVDSDVFLVLEGNRRVTAIRNLLSNDKLPTNLRSALEKIEVMEVLAEGDPEDLRMKISYLLGVRHHGSLQPWRPYSQAHNIYGHYLRLAQQTNASFNWDENVANQIADSLSLKTSMVKERLQVFRAMQQIGATQAVKAGESSGGGMKESYYSICKEGLLSNSAAVLEFLNQDAQTFLLGEQGVERMESLCSFSTPKRNGAPMNTPPEWRYFAKILGDDDPAKKELNTQAVVTGHRRPSSVWAAREEELRRLQWDRWLEKVSLLLQKVSFGDDFGEDAKSAISRLSKVIDELTMKEKGPAQ